MNKPENVGRDAFHPAQIPWRGWMQIFKRVIDDIGEHHVRVLSAGVAFYFLLSLFPIISAMISIYGLITDSADIADQLIVLADLLPANARDLISDMMNKLANKPSTTLSWNLVFSLLISWWIANLGTLTLFEGINVAYKEKDERSFVKKLIISLIFTLGGIVGGLILLALIAGIPAVAGAVNLPGFVNIWVEWLRWPFVALVVILALGLAYRIAPQRKKPRARWVSWGAIFATLLWLLGSLLFSVYVENFGTFDSTFGSFGAIVILMLWFFLTAFIFMLGAEINSNMEYQTRRDTTIGDDQPQGKRGAFYADNVAGEENHD